MELTSFYELERKKEGNTWLEKRPQAEMFLFPGNTLPW